MEKKKPDLSERCFKDMLDVYSDCEDADKVDVVWSIDHICHEIRNHPDRAIGALTQLKLRLIKDLKRIFQKYLSKTEQKCLTIEIYYAIIVTKCRASPTAQCVERRSVAIS